jgi:hypothetical protein
MINRVYFPGVDGLSVFSRGQRKEQCRLLKLLKRSYKIKNGKQIYHHSRASQAEYFTAVTRTSLPSDGLIKPTTKIVI